VLTDAGEKPGREVALRFEQIRVAFGCSARGCGWILAPSRRP
jgi:hypothetical protein